MPTDLPRTRSKITRRPPAKTHAVARRKPALPDRLLNSFMVGTMLILGAVVVLQEKHYADGKPGTVADVFLQKAQAAIGGTGVDNGGGPN